MQIPVLDHVEARRQSVHCANTPVVTQLRVGVQYCKVTQHIVVEWEDADHLPNDSLVETSNTGEDALTSGLADIVGSLSQQGSRVEADADDVVVDVVLRVVVRHSRQIVGRLDRTHRYKLCHEQAKQAGDLGWKSRDLGGVGLEELRGSRMNERKWKYAFISALRRWSAQRFTWLFNVCVALKIAHQRGPLLKKAVHTPLEAQPPSAHVFEQLQWLDVGELKELLILLFAFRAVWEVKVHINE